MGAWPRRGRTRTSWARGACTPACGAHSRSRRRSRVREADDLDADSALGRAFDRRLAARLWTISQPHRRLILGAIVLFPFVSAVELLQPYLLKVAIDGH